MALSGSGFMNSSSGSAPIDIVTLLAGCHSELTSADPSINASVLLHINSQSNTRYGLATSISKQGQASSVLHLCTHIIGQQKRAKARDLSRGTAVYVWAQFAT
ncbi:hypothetical protein MH117_17885 [Paenibacillus sp. ACRRX]|uniref:hypothetical protein n=1 Tax=Paenibacillus sp. ACRRX TaxID=2918206 RepID=UPI001EF431DA|nr:hypothetical protein [Paenibacillus sp. ACRRX]MCG7409291.1 hypothetical protein [Paenibacillus sp. ACRRX]